MAISLKDLTIEGVVSSFKAREFSVRELTEQYLENIKEKNDDVGAYIEVFEDVVKEAEILDKELKEGARIGPLFGVPLAVKDNILIKNKVAPGLIAPWVNALE